MSLCHGPMCSNSSPDSTQSILKSRILHVIYIVVATLWSRSAFYFYSAVHGYMLTTGIIIVFRHWMLKSSCSLRLLFFSVFIGMEFC